MIYTKLFQSQGLLVTNNIYISKAIAGAMSLIIITFIFTETFSITPYYINHLLINPLLSILLITTFIITFYIHELGHYMWGHIAGGKVTLFFNINNFYIARITKFTKTSLIMFSLGGPVTNILFGFIFIALLQNKPDLLIDQLLFMSAFLNLVCGFGALIPNCPNRGGLLYYKYIFQYDKIISEERSN